MRSAIIALQLCFLVSAFAHPSHLSPFAPASDQAYSHNDTSYRSPSPDDPRSFDLRRRQYCQANYNACANVGAPRACCSTGAVCSLDNAGQIACCPIGSFCTGTVAISTAAAATPTPAATTTNLVTSTDNGQLITVTVTSTAPAVVVATATASYVPNSYFPYPYIPASFQNSALCAAAYSTCASNFAACTADLAASGGYAVTISAPGGGGVTISPTAATSLPAASAAAVCSSLSSQACPGTSGTCATFGTAAATGIVTSGSLSNRLEVFPWRWWIGGLFGATVGVIEGIL